MFKHLAKRNFDDNNANALPKKLFKVDNKETHVQHKGKFKIITRKRITKLYWAPGNQTEGGLANTPVKKTVLTATWKNVKQPLETRPAALAHLWMN